MSIDDWIGTERQNIFGLERDVPLTRKPLEEPAPWFFFTPGDHGIVVCTLGPYGDMESSTIFHLHEDYLRTFERDFHAYMAKRAGR